MGINALSWGKENPKVYIAGPWVRREEIIKVGQRFKEAGFEVTSRWFTHEGDPNDSTGANVDPKAIQKQALEDIEDVCRADVFVVVNLQKSEGKAVETGIAIMQGIPVISVGTRSNIFQALGIEVNTIEEAIQEALNVV